VAEDKTVEEIYLYAANGQTAGYEPHVVAHQTAAQAKDWAWDKKLRVYEIVPEDPQQMFGTQGNRTYYFVRGRGAKGKVRYFSVSRNSYYFNKHPFFSKRSERHLLIPDA
jgi:hypothetical protein